MNWSRRRAGPPGLGPAEAFGAWVGAGAGVPPWPQFPADRTLLTFQGRTAIALACRMLGLGAGDEVLLPSWNCGTEVDAVLAAGPSVVLYRTDARGRIDAADLRRRRTARTRAVYVIHYFGWPQDLAEVRDLCRESGLLLIEDCALAMFSEPGGVPLGRDADAAIYSFPKTFAVPDGGALVLGRAPASFPALTPPAGPRTLKRTLGLVKRRLQRTGGPVSAGDGQGLPLHEPQAGRPDMPASYYWDERTALWSASRVTRGVLARADPRDVAARRRANYARLLARIRTLPGVTPLFDDLPAGVCPLELAVLVGARDAWVSALGARGIVAVPWWAGYHRGLGWDGFPDACGLKDHVVALPVNQDLDDASVDAVAAAVADLARSASAAR